MEYYTVKPKEEYDTNNQIIRNEEMLRLIKILEEVLGQDYKTYLKGKECERFYSSTSKNLKASEKLTEIKKELLEEFDIDTRKEIAIRIQKEIDKYQTQEEPMLSEQVANEIMKIITNNFNVFAYLVVMGDKDMTMEFLEMGWNECLQENTYNTFFGNEKKRNLNKSFYNMKINKKIKEFRAELLEL